MRELLDKAWETCGVPSKPDWLPVQPLSPLPDRGDNDRALVAHAAAALWTQQTSHIVCYVS